MIENIHEFSFESDGHKYEHRGQRVPSVTGLLTQYGIISYAGVRSDVLERKRELGSAVHKFTENYDRNGEEDFFTVTEEAENYCHAWLDFRRRSGFEVLEIERPLMGKVHGVLIAGTPDREFRWKKGVKVTGDLKCCTVRMPSWKVQTAAYRMLRDAKANLAGGDRVSIQLFPDRKWDLVWYTDRADGDVFMAIASIEAFRQNHGINGRG